MVPRVETPSLARRSSIGRATIAVTLAAVLAGCGSTVGANPSARASARIDPASSSSPPSCPATVLNTLASVLMRVYHEGVDSERTASARYLITHSAALSAAVEGGNKAAARAAAKALLATGHMTDLRVMRGTQTFVNVGGPAVAPLGGTLIGANGASIGSYVASVWADNGFLAEAGGITQGLVALRAGRSWIGGRSVRGSPVLGSGALPTEGTLTHEHVLYRYTSFPAEAYPSGALRVYLLIPLSSSTGLCGGTSEDTTVNTLDRVAKLIYAGEIGDSALTQVQRVQRNRALLEAVAHREPEATRRAIGALLNHHIVRLRVSAGGQLLSDVGGPYVLGPVRASLHLDGRTIGSFVLSIQDDEGYLRLARRLAGLDVLIYLNSVNSAHPQLVKNSLGPAPGPVSGTVPAGGAFRYEGRDFRVFTVPAEAFPSGPLTIRVLVRMPYP